MIPDPHVTSYVLHPRDRYLVLCSDGISDVLNPSFILDLIHQCKHAQQGDMMVPLLPLVPPCLISSSESRSGHPQASHDELEGYCQDNADPRPH